MHKSVAVRIVVSVLCAVAMALVGAGIYGINKRAGEKQETILSEMRVRSLLVATGEGAVESFVAAAKKEAVEKARAAGASMAEIRAASENAEAETRENTSASTIDYSQVDQKPVAAALLSLRKSMEEYSAEKSAAIAAFIDQQAALVTLTRDALMGGGADGAAEAPPDGAGAPVDGPIDVGAEPGGEGFGDDLLLDEPEAPVLDLTGFQATPEMIRLQGAVDENFDTLSKALQEVYPILDDVSLLQLKPMILQLTYQDNDRYQTEYDRYKTEDGLNGVSGSAWLARVIRYGDDMVSVGVWLLIQALIIYFYDQIKRRIALPLIIIGSFFLLLCLLSLLLDLSIKALLSNSIMRMGMNSIMVLAMVPAIQCGIALNLGLPIGIIGGLVGGLMCIELGFTGWWGFLFAVLVGLALSGVFGYFYSLLLNRLKGSEMAVTTYVGFSVVSLSCIAWLVLPFRSLLLRWPLGMGLRATISLEPAFMRLLDRFLAFTIGGVKIPTGLLLFMIVACFLMWLFSRTRTGIAMQAVGNNPRFAEATGVNVNRMRIIGTMLSTMLGAVGIIIYSQSYGYMQLYTAPRTLGLTAAAAILIGGASTTRTRISHVLIGTFLFHSILALSMPVANELVPGSTIAEVLRLLVSNGIILYALTKSGGASRA